MGKNSKSNKKYIMKIFYNERGKNGKYFELQDVEDFPKMKKIKGIFAKGVQSGIKINFNYSLENVIDGSYSFYWNWELESFNSNLSKLENGVEMFRACINLTSFSADLSSLIDGLEMFYNSNNLTTFSSNLSSLVDGEKMFGDCDALTSFAADLSSLTNGEKMFSYCTNLTSFSSNLGSLKSGYEMFYNCKLDTESLSNIADNINDISDLDKDNDGDWIYELLGKTKTISSTYRGRIDIGHDESVAQEVLQYCGNKLIDKGWTTVYFNGTLYEYVTDASPYDVSEANGYIPDAYKNGSDSWNTVVLTPNMDVLKISIVNEKGEMLNDE